MALDVYLVRHGETEWTHTGQHTGRTDLPLLPEGEEQARRLGELLRDVDTPGVLAHRPPSLLAVLPDTDIAGTAHAANRVLEAVNSALAPAGRRAGLGIVCIQHGQRVRAGAVIEAAARSLKDGGRPEFLGR